MYFKLHIALRWPSVPVFCGLAVCLCLPAKCNVVWLCT
jgi:hypothetical protein